MYLKIIESGFWRYNIDKNVSQELSKAASGDTISIKMCLKIIESGHWRYIFDKDVSQNYRIRPLKIQFR